MQCTAKMAMIEGRERDGNADTTLPKLDTTGRKRNKKVIRGTASSKTAAVSSVKKGRIRTKTRRFIARSATEDNKKTREMLKQPKGGKHKLRRSNTVGSTPKKIESCGARKTVHAECTLAQ